jgi:hypothetical protein
MQFRYGLADPLRGACADMLLEPECYPSQDRQERRWLGNQHTVTACCRLQASQPLTKTAPSVVVAGQTHQTWTNRSHQPQPPTKAHYFGLGHM